MRGVLTSLAMAVLLCRAAAEEPITLTWHLADKPDGLGRQDELEINGVRLKDSGDLEQYRSKADAALRPGQTVTTPVHVTIPVRANSDFDKTPIIHGGGPILILSGLTLPERDVTYFYKGKGLRRYLIRATEGIRGGGEHADYWLDGNPLGTWDKAREKFDQVKWEKGSVVDLMIERKPILEASGNGFWNIPTELEDLLRKNQVTINPHARDRKLLDQ